MVHMEDMVGALLPAIEAAQTTAKTAGRDLYFVVTVCGTTKDPQNYQMTSRSPESSGGLCSRKKRESCSISTLVKRCRNVRSR